MEVFIDNHKLKVNIIRKVSNKNTYVRLKDDGVVQVTTNYFVGTKTIEKLILSNEDFIRKALKNLNEKKARAKQFFFLGKEYEVISHNKKKIEIVGDKVFTSDGLDIDKWLKKEAKVIFSQRLEKIVNSFSYKIPLPSLTIRKMTSRWGVCNVRAKKITLNLELIKKDIFYIDYVIVHELAHLVEANHSKAFWQVVEENFPDYKIARKNLKY